MISLPLRTSALIARAYPDQDSYTLHTITILFYFQIVTLLIVLGFLGFGLYLDAGQKRYGLWVAAALIPLAAVLLMKGYYKPGLYLMMAVALAAIIIGLLFGGGHYSTLLIPIVFFLVFGSERSTLMTIAAMILLVFVKYHYFPNPRNHSPAWFGILLTILVVSILLWDLKAILEQRLKLMSMAVDQSSDGIVITDLNGQIEFVNSGMLEMTGYSAKELKGRHTAVFSAGDKDPAKFRQLWQTIRSGRVWAGEFHNRRKNGEDLWTSSTVCPIVQNGEIINYLSIQQDISRVKQEAAARADLERILYHDLRTPLNAVVGLAELLLTEMQLKESENREYLQLIHKSGLNMSHMIETSLQLQKLKSGAFEPVRQRFDLMELIHELISLQRPARVEKNIQYQLLHNQKTVATAEQLFVFAEYTVLYSALSNLLKNAVEAAPEGSQIQILVATAAGLAIAIHNAGSIPAAIRDKIFGKYVTAGKQKGTGLGLYSVRLLMEAVGGQVSFTSSDSAGTTFQLQLPDWREP
ncbi:MAG: PAS domain S-box protein [Leptospiraceae bacterium]|nr:PAS domain S-box protein [Leptospiraceae bacterium]